MESLTNEQLNQARQQGDPAADQLIDQLVQQHGPEMARRLFDLLIRNIEMPIELLPEEVEHFVHQHHKRPAWVDQQQIELAEQVFLDHGPKFLIFLYFKSLPTLYANANGAQVLIDTGRMAHGRTDRNIFSRRVAETGQFLLDVMSPGGLAAGGKGVHAALKVRLIHAAIRHFLQQGDWDEIQLGKPINQEDLALTLMTFSISMIEGMEISEHPLPPKEAEAYLHAWKLVGHYLGIDPALIPADVAAGKQLLKAILDRQARSSEAGQLLTQSLLEFVAYNLPGKALDKIPWILTRYLLGDPLSDLLKVHRKRGIFSFLLPRFLRRWLRIAETVEDWVDPFSTVLDRVSVRLARKLVGYFDEYKQSYVRVEKEVRKRWGVEREV